jgi:hypothetical protein
LMAAWLHPLMASNRQARNARMVVSPVKKISHSLVDLVQGRFRDRSGAVQRQVFNLAPYPKA